MKIQFHLNLKKINAILSYKVLGFLLMCSILVRAIRGVYIGSEKPIVITLEWVSIALCLVYLFLLTYIFIKHDKAKPDSERVKESTIFN